MLISKWAFPKNSPLYMKEKDKKDPLKKRQEYVFRV
jgi:hypothetical protein